VYSNAGDCGAGDDFPPRLYAGAIPRLATVAVHGGKASKGRNAFRGIPRGRRPRIRKGAGSEAERVETE